MARKSYAVVGLCLSLAVLAAASCERAPHGRVVVNQGECYTCHQAEYEATTMPPHAGLYSTECGMCHNEIDWGTIQHTWFPLQNRHDGVPCADCHTVGFRLGDTPTTCVGCHRPAYDATTMPQHVLSGGAISTACAACHNDLGWTPSTFVHAWPLTGRHAPPTACQRCHGAPVPTPPPAWPTYAGTPNGCFDCHAADRTRGDTLHTGHSTYSTDCGDCHTTIGWTPAIGGGHPESRFPIAGGAHSGIACLDCHDPALGSSSMGMNTNCVRCHSDAAGDHRDVARYPASPPNAHFCLDCHPDGRN